MVDINMVKSQRVTDSFATGTTFMGDLIWIDSPFNFCIKPTCVLIINSLSTLESHINTLETLSSTPSLTGTSEIDTYNLAFTLQERIPVSPSSMTLHRHVNNKIEMSQRTELILSPAYLVTATTMCSMIFTCLRALSLIFPARTRSPLSLTVS